MMDVDYLTECIDSETDRTVEVSCFQDLTC